MITLLELGFEDYLATRVTAANLGYPVDCRPATSREPLPNDRAVIYAQVVNLPQDPPSSPLWLAELAFYVVSDTSIKSVTAEHHGALELLITDAFEQSCLAAITSAVETRLTGYQARSFVRNRWMPGREGTKWAPSLSITLAVGKA